MRFLRSLKSNRKRNSPLTEAIILIISVPSIGSLLQTYEEVIALWKNTSCVPLYSPTIACAFFEKAVIFFNTRDFMIIACKKPIYYSQGCTHIFEYALKPTVRVNDKNHNHAEHGNGILHGFFH